MLGEIPGIPKDSKRTRKELDDDIFENPAVLLNNDVEAMCPSIDLRNAISKLRLNASVLSERGIEINSVQKLYWVFKKNCRFSNAAVSYLPMMV